MAKVESEVEPEDAESDVPLASPQFALCLLHPLIVELVVVVVVDEVVELDVEVVELVVVVEDVGVPVTVTVADAVISVEYAQLVVITTV